MPQNENATAPFDQAEVLVVDDDKNYRRIAVLRLTAAGCRCYEASSGDEALAALHLRPGISVVLLDYTMYGRGPGELISRIREKRPEVSIIGHSSADRAKAFRELRVETFLRKPLVEEEFQRIIQGSSGI
jgi:DNA-binding NtrC family response regulator